MLREVVIAMVAKRRRRVIRAREDRKFSASLAPFLVSNEPGPFYNAGVVPSQLGLSVVRPLDIKARLGAPYTRAAELQIADAVIAERDIRKGTAVTGA